MERLQKSHREFLPPVCLCLEDIEAIIREIRGVAKEVRMETDEFALKDGTELENLGSSSIHELNLRSDQPDISLSLSPGSVCLAIGRDDAASRGVFEKIKTILRRCRRRILFWSDKVVNLSGFVGGIILAGIIWALYNNKWFAAVLASALAIYILWMYWTLRELSRHYSTIFIARRSAQLGFLQRNRDTILVAIISALVGGLVMLGAQGLIRFLWQAGAQGPTP